MRVENCSNILLETINAESSHLDRSVQIDLYLPARGLDDGSRQNGKVQPSLLFINDGQDLENLGLANMLDDLYARERIAPLICAGIHAGPDRKWEYGTAGVPDYLGRGARAALYRQFVLEELLPLVREWTGTGGFAELAFAGFSLGALSAMDIVWSNPGVFSKAGLFSGSFWWRTRDKADEAYQDESDRIMHRRVRERSYHAGQRFFFECGTDDEAEDRNGNGVIDSIDDTHDLIRELLVKGYDPRTELHYLELEGGKHDVATWGRAMPVFLEWGWGR